MLSIGVSLGAIITFMAMMISVVEKEKLATQKLINELQSKRFLEEEMRILDSVSPREYAINEISKRKLVWDEKTQSYIVKK
jgi:hypothetical protein